MKVRLFFKWVIVRIRYTKLFRLIKDTDFLATLSFTELEGIRWIFGMEYPNPIYTATAKINAKKINKDVSIVMAKYKLYLGHDLSYIYTLIQEEIEK
jgi:hypothetical protein